MRFILAALLCSAVVPFLHAQPTDPSLGGCSLLPANNVWHARVDNLPVHPRSSTYVATLGASAPAHPDFGYDADNGIPYNLVHGNSTPAAKVTIAWPFTSDPGPYPIPANAKVETPGDASNPNDDHHLIVLDVDNCVLYEAYGAIQTSKAANSWNITNISKFNLNSDALKPADWSSSNAAGTTYLPGLIRYDEVASGHIEHAIAMTATGVGNTFAWPANRTASYKSGSQYPPMGTRFRLKSSVDLSGFSPNVRVIFEALKTYGAIVIDNGASWFMVGVPDSRWNDDEMHAMTQLHGSDFEAVDESSLISSTSSGQVSPRPVPTGWVNIVNKMSGKCLHVPGGTPILAQWTCEGTNAQKFQFLPWTGAWNFSNLQDWVSAAGNGYIIESASSGLAAEVQNGSTQPGASLMVGTYYDKTNRIWQVIPAGNGYFYIQSLLDGLVVDNTLPTGYANGSVANQWSNLGSDNQLWELVPVSQ